MTEGMRGLLRRIANPGIYVGAVIAAVLVVAAYQVRPTYDIAVGSPTDGPVLRGFNAGERMQGDPSQTFRWTGDDSYIVLQGVGTQDFDVTLTLSGNRPPGQPPATLRVESEGETLLDFQPRPDLTDYSISIPREKVRDGTLTLHLLTNAFTPPGDPRTLGIVVSRIQVAPGPNPDRFIVPPIGMLASVAGAVALFGLVLALLGWGMGGVLLGSVAVSALAAGLLAWDRLWLTSGGWHAIWPQAIVAAAIFTAMIWLIGRWLLRDASYVVRHGSTLAFRVLLTLVFVVFAVRLAGQLHPQIFIVDLFYHVHRFEDAQNGKLIYMHVASELAGRDTFYLMTAYIFMMPLQWLIGDIPLAVRLFTIGLSTAGAFLLYYMGVSVLRSARAGLIAAALYLTMPLSVLVFSWGITTNVFAEFFVLLIFTVFVVAPDLHPRRPAFWLLVGLLLVGVLSHPAVVQILSFAIILMCVVWFLAGMRGGSDTRGRAFQVAGAFALAVLAAFLLYYRNILPTMLATLSEIGSSRGGEGSTSEGDGISVLIGGAVHDRTLGLLIREVHTWGEWFWGGLLGLWREFWAYFNTWPLLGALLGFLVLAPARGRSLPAFGPVSRLRMAGFVWAMSTLVFALVGWGLNLYVRYSLFLLPVVALGAGILLSRIWNRGRWGRALSLLLVAFYALAALFLWQFRINYGLK
jgi:hypothetical protein